MTDTLNPRLMWHCECGNTPCDGLNCGVQDAPRKKPSPKPPEVISAIRKAAWNTRRTKYGQRGHK